MTDPDIFLVLDRATDAIRPAEEPHQAAASALARARVVRTRRKGLVAGAVATAAVVAVVVATGLPGSDRTAPPVEPVPTVPAVPAVSDEVVQAAWDPRAAAELPREESVFPAAIDLPSDPLELPLSGPARVLLADGEQRLHLVAGDGRWGWTQAPSGAADISSLSDDGTMLANLGNGQLFVTDVRYGGYDWREIELPPELTAFTGLDTRLQWRDNTHLVVSSYGGGVAVIDVTAPAAPETDVFDLVFLNGYAESPDGTGLAFGDAGGRVVREVEDGEVTASAGADALENVWQPVATDSLVAGVVSGLPQADRPTDHGGIVVLDRDGYSAVAFLPITGTTYEPGFDASGFGAGGVSPVAWIDDRTLLLGTGSGSLGRPWSLVSWELESGELSLVSTGGTTIRLLGVARDLVDE